VKALDGRHKWEYMGRDGLYDVHTCRACGKTQRFERIIPDAVLDALLANLTKPNPYRAMFR
jgi:hypothetical protein